MTFDPAILTKLDELLAAIRGFADPRRASAEWKQAYKLLQATALPAATVTHVVGMRDALKLAEMIDQLRASAGEAAPPPSVDTPDDETCRHALRAFRKRLKLTRLDDDSRLGHGPLSSGKNSKLAAIIPPDEWPDAVWKELARQGKLRDIGHGFYELAE